MSGIASETYTRFKKEETPSKLKQKKTVTTMSKSHIKETGNGKDSGSTNIFVFNNFINIGMAPGATFASQAQAIESATRLAKRSAHNSK